MEGNHIMQTVHQITSYLAHYVQGNEKAILTYLLAGGAVSLAVRALSNFRQWEHGSTRVKAAGVISAVGSLSNWVINNYSTSPLASLGDIGPRILVAAIFMHEFVLNPLGAAAKWLGKSKVGDYINVTALVKDAAAYRAEQHTATGTDNQFL